MTTPLTETCPRCTDTWLCERHSWLLVLRLAELPNSPLLPGSPTSSNYDQTQSTPSQLDQDRGKAGDS